MDMQHLSLDDVLRYLYTSNDSFEDFWKFYFTIVFAVLGFVVSARKYLDRTRGLVIAATFALFAYADWKGLDFANQQRWALYNAGSDALTAANISAVAFVPTDPRVLFLSHFAVDVVVIGLIIYLTHELRLEKPSHREQ